MAGLLVSTQEGGNFNISLADGGTLQVQSQAASASGVVAVTGTAPITSSGGPVPNIAITAATDLAAGSMSAADKTKLDGITAGAAVASVSGVAPIGSTGGTTPAISIAAATEATPGSMSAADKTKLDGLTPGAAVSAVTGSNGVASSGGTAPNISWIGLGDISSAGLVDSISGPSPIAITPAVLQWAQGTVAPTISQAQQANGAVPQSIALTPAAPGAAATNATNGTPGGVTVTLAAPVNSGNEAAFTVARVGGPSFVVGALTALPTAEGIWCGSPAPSVTNYSFLFFNSGITNYNIATVAGGALHQFFADGATGFFCTGKIGNGQGTNLTSNDSGFGVGVGVWCFSEATTEPTANGATKTIAWSFTDGAFKCRSKNGWRANLLALGSGALNTQQPFVDTFSAVVRTVSSATPAAFGAYTTTSGTVGWINVRLKSKAATTAGGITTGDGAFAEYRLGYKNVGGTVTLSTAGITLLGAVQTTNALLTSVLTAAAVGATVVLSVTNVAGNTVDSLIDCTIDVC